MARFLLKFLLFFTCLLGFLFLLAQYDNNDRETNGDHNVVKINRMSSFDSLDILFIGNSYCYSSIYPPLFDSLNLKTFNLGIATSGPDFYEILINDYLKSVHDKPDTIMMLLSLTTFSTQADDWKNYPIHRYLQHPLSNEEVASAFNIYEEYPAMLFNSVRKGLNNVFFQSGNSEKESEKIFLYKGLFLDSSKTNDSLEQSIKYLFTPLLQDRFDEQEAEKLLILANKLKNQNIKVIFFEVPTYKLEEYYSKEFKKEYDLFCNKLSSRFPVIRNDLRLDSIYFRNIDHTNTIGAYYYTKHLIKTMYSPDFIAKQLVK